MPCAKGGGLCKMIFKSKYELYEFHLVPSLWSICRFKKKNKWANYNNRLLGGQKGELGMLGIDRAMFNLENKISTKLIHTYIHTYFGECILCYLTV